MKGVFKTMQALNGKIDPTDFSKLTELRESLMRGSARS